MSPKSYLEQYQKLKSELKNREAELAMIEWEEYAPGGIDYSKDRVQSSPGDKMLSLILRKQMRSEELESRIRYLESTMKTIEEEVNQAEEDVFIRLLHLRYIERQGWESVTNQLAKEGIVYSVEHIKGYMHQKALRSFWKVKRLNTH